jgi:hypothetical protein
VGSDHVTERADVDLPTRLAITGLDNDLEATEILDEVGGPIAMGWHGEPHQPLH